MKSFIIICCFFLLLGACQSKPKGYVIKGMFEGAPENEWVFLTDLGQKVYYDSVQLKGGQFEFRGKIDHPELRCITFFKNPAQRLYGWSNIMVVPVFVENSTIRITLPFSELPSKAEKSVPENLRVEGSSSHDLYAKYKERVIPFTLKYDSLFEAYRQAYYRKKGTEDDVFRYVREMDAIRDSTFAIGVEFIRQYQASPVALYIAKNLRVRAYSRAKAKQVAGLLPETVKATSEGQQAVKALLEQPLYVGDMLPDFDVLNTDLQTVKLSTFLKKGHYTLVELWASWCGPCRADIPHLKETYQRYHEKGFEMISISIDEDKEAWLKAVKEEEMPWIQVYGANGKSYTKECMKLFGVSGVPSCVLIDKEGNVLSTNARGGWLNEKLKILFEN